MVSRDHAWHGSRFDVDRAERRLQVHDLALHFDEQQSPPIVFPPEHVDRSSVAVLVVGILGDSPPVRAEAGDRGGNQASVPGIGKPSEVRPACLEFEIDADFHSRADLPHGPESHVARATVLDRGHSLLGDARPSGDVGLSQSPTTTFGSNAHTDLQIIHRWMMRGANQLRIYRESPNHGREADRRLEVRGLSG
jgi:hypothetical protein